MMPTCDWYDTFDKFFNKAVALEVTPDQTNKPQQLQQQQQKEPTE
jgi:hypothetical protein